MNRAIEIHDSKVLALLHDGRDIIVRFRPAYVHSSDGRPGFDVGAGYSQELDLVILGAESTSSISEFPQELDDGEIMLGELVHHNLIPLPLSFQGRVRFTARGLHGDSMVINGTGANVEFRSEPTYVEPFPGMNEV